MDAMPIVDAIQALQPDFDGKRTVTGIPVGFETSAQCGGAAHVMPHSTEGVPANYALSLLSHLKEIIFSTYKKDRSRITWTLCRVNVGRVLLLSHRKDRLEETPLAAPGKQLANPHEVQQDALGGFMPDGSKRLFAAGGFASEARSKYRFLPSAALPPDLPEGPVPIADMANAFGVTHRTLHFYEEKGLISANRIGLMRVYGQDDVMRMAVITVCRETGMPIAVIQELMDELRKADSQERAEAMFREALQVRRRELTAEMSTLHRQLQQVGDLLDYDGSIETRPLNDNQDNSGLTPQEKRCLELMAEGYSTQRIARALDLKHDETRDIEAAIILKFRANNRFQAIAKAVLLGIVQA